MGNYIFNGAIYLIAIVLLVVSFIKSRPKTKQALFKAWNSFKNILPMLLGVILLVGLTLSILDTKVISKIIGNQSGFYGVMLASLLGSITLIPGFIAFPTAALLLNGGAGYIQIAAFVQTLMMVGIVTLPMEIKYFNKKVAVVFMKKQVKFSNIIILIGAWSTTKIPMLLFEMSSLGFKFALLRLGINIFVIIIIAYVMGLVVKKDEITQFMRKLIIYKLHYNLYYKF